MLNKTPHFATVPASDLAAANRIAGYVVERRSTIPIIEHALISADKGVMTIRGTDLEREITITLPCEGDGGAACMPVHGVMKTLPGLTGDVSIRVEGETVHFDTDRLRFKKPALSPDDYPKMEDREITERFTVPAQELGWALERCLPSISTEETRYYLNGVYLHWRINTPGISSLAAVATDGHKLALCRLDGTSAFEPAKAPLALPPPSAPVKTAKGKGKSAPAAKPEKPAKVAKPKRAAKVDAPASPLEAFKAIIPRKTVMVLVKLLAKIDEGDVTVTRYGDTHVAFEAANWRLMSKTIDGTFPDYGRVIPELSGNAVTVDAAALAGVLDRMDGLTEGSSISLSAVKGKLQLAVGDATETLEATITGKLPTFGVNMRHLAHGCWLMHGDTIRIDIHDASSPMRLVDPAQDEDDDMIAVLMPMRVGG